MWDRLSKPSDWCIPEVTAHLWITDRRTPSPRLPELATGGVGLPPCCGCNKCLSVAARNQAGGDGGHRGRDARRYAAVRPSVLCFYAAAMVFCSERAHIQEQLEKSKSTLHQHTFKDKLTPTKRGSEGQICTFRLERRQNDNLLLLFCLHFPDVSLKYSSNSIFSQENYLIYGLT